MTDIELVEKGLSPNRRYGELFTRVVDGNEYKSFENNITNRESNFTGMVFII